MVVGLTCLIPAVILWDYAGILDWTQHWTVIAVSACSVLMLPLLRRRHRPWSPLQFCPPILALMVILGGLAQATSWPTVLSRWLAPGVHFAYAQFIPDEIRDELSQRLSGDDSRTISGIEQSWHPATVSRFNTYSALTAPGLSAVVFVIVIVSIRDQRGLVILMTITASSGVVVSALSIFDVVRYVGPGGSENLFTPSFHGSSPFGPFINRNNAGGYLNATLASTVGLLLWSLRKAARDTEVDSQYRIDPETTWERLSSILVGVVGRLNATSTTLLAMAILQIVAIASSNSRGAMVACVTAGFVTVLFTGRTRSRLQWTLAILAIGVLIGARWLLVYLSLDAEVSERVRSIFTLSEGSQVGRLKHLVDATHAAIAYFPSGAGLGTYQYAILPHQSATAGHSMFVNADCMPLEWLVEGGIWLPCLILAGVLVVVRTIGRLSLQQRSHSNAMATMASFLLISQLVASFFDFGVLMPSNYLTISILFAAAFSAAMPASDLPKRRYRQKSSSSTKYQSTKYQSTKHPSAIGTKTRSVEILQSDAVEEVNKLNKLASRLTAMLMIWQTFQNRHRLQRLVSPMIILLMGLVLMNSFFTTRQHARTSYEAFAFQRILNQPDKRSGSATWFSSPAEAILQSMKLSPDPQRNFLASLATLELEERSARSTVTLDQEKLLSENKSIADAEFRKLRSDPRISVRRLIAHRLADETRPDGLVSSSENFETETLLRARVLAMTSLVQCPLHPFVRLPLIKTDFLQFHTSGDPSLRESVPWNRVSTTHDDGPLTTKLVNDALALQPRNPALIEPLLRLTYVYPGADVANQLVTRMLEMNPDHFASVWPFLSAQADKDVERAATVIPDNLECSLVVSLDPIVPESLRDLMISRAEMAIQAKIQQTRIGEQNGDLYYAAAQLAKAKGQMDLATKYLGEAVSINPSNATYRIEFADLLEMQKQYDEAIKQLRRVIIQNPRDARVLKKLKQLVSQTNRGNNEAR